MDVGALRRVLKQCGRWRALQDHVRNLPERASSIGRALTRAEQRRLFDVAASNPEWEHVYCAATVAANTSMRPVEVKHLRRRDVDLFAGTATVARSKNMTSHRVIPLNRAARKAIIRMLDVPTPWASFVPITTSGPRASGASSIRLSRFGNGTRPGDLSVPRLGCLDYGFTISDIPSSQNWRRWACPITSSSRSRGICRAVCSSTTRTSALRRSDRRLRRWRRGGPSRTQPKNQQNPR